jgi:hypothetical protein
MERQSVRPSGDLYDDCVVDAFVRIVFAKFDPEASRLNPYRRVTLRVESRWPAQYLRRNLVFLQGNSGVIEGVFSEVAQQFAEGFGRVKAMAFNKFIYLLEALLPPNGETVRHSHITCR